ncbi:MAG: aminotransferase class V-fold PLP-dependent enzyme, partial [Cyanobacteria bacterium J06639_1]
RNETQDRWTAGRPLPRGGLMLDFTVIHRLLKAHGEALVIVDAVTSVGATSVPTDEWGLDLVASGSQKGYMMPPGLGFVAVSDRAMEATKRSKLPKYYWSFEMAKKSLAKHTTPFTPAVNLVFALQATLKSMREEGLPALFARHDRLAAATRAGAKALGLDLLAPESSSSPAVTAINAPEGVDAEALRAILNKRFGIATAAGQNRLKGKIFRIGHLGYICDRDIVMTFAAIEAALPELGYDSFNSGDSVATVSRVLAG